MTLIKITCLFTSVVLHMKNRYVRTFQCDMTNSEKLNLKYPKVMILQQNLMQGSHLKNGRRSHGGA